MSDDCGHYPEAATLAEVCRRWALTRPTHPAFTLLESGGEPAAVVDYATLYARACTVAARLRERFAPGTVAILMYPPGLEFVIGLVGCMVAGVLPAPVHPPKRNRSNQRIIGMIERAAAQVVLSEEAMLGELDAVGDFGAWPAGIEYIATDRIESTGAVLIPHRPARGEDPVFLQFTSGSTSLPKGVTVTHAGLLHNLRMIQATARTTEETRFLSWLPHYHDLGLVAHILESLYCGGHCLLLNPTAVISHPLRWLQAMSRHRVHYSGAPDFAFRLCLKKISAREREALDLSSMRVLINAAEPIRADTLLRFCEYFGEAGLAETAVMPAYGLAEATVFVSANSPDCRPVVKRVARDLYQREGRVVTCDSKEQEALELIGCGPAGPDSELLIVEPGSGLALPEGRVGEIWIGGSHLMAGYYGDETATAQAFGRLPGSQTRYLRTGDLGFLSEGELFVSGRIKDLLIARGVNHYPQDIERAAEGVCGGLRSGGAAAFGVSGEEGDELVLVLELERDAVKRISHAPASGDELIRSVVSAVQEAADLPIAAIMLVQPGQIPNTSSGKVCRQECRRKYLAGELRAIRAWSGKVLKQMRGEENMSNVDRILRAVVAMGPEHLQVFGHLTRVLEEKCGIALSSLDLEHSLFFYGVDSLQIVDVQAGLERALGHSIATDLFFSAGNILDLVEELVKSLHTVSGAPSERQIATDVERLGTEAAALYREASRSGRRRGGSGVLLTGATGYVGIYLLKELLLATAGPVYCTARAASATAAKERILRNAARYDIRFDSAEQVRIRPLVADISRERLGLAEAEYDLLAADIDAIYHCAAMDNFYLPYSVLRPTNVMGTVEMIRLALHGGVIPLYHVSSCAASLLEDNGCEDGGLVNGYAKTKYVAEQVVRRLIAAGFPGISFRFGYLYSLEADMADAGESFETFLTAVFELGCYPEMEMVFDLTPVEYAAKGIVLAAALPEAARPREYTLYNPVPVRWSDLCACFRDLREEMRPVPLHEFERLFQDYVERSSRKSVKLLRSVVSQRLADQVNRMFRDVAVDKLPLASWCPPCDMAFARHYLHLVLGIVPEATESVEAELALAASGG